MLVPLSVAGLVPDCQGSADVHAGLRALAAAHSLFITGKRQRVPVLAARGRRQTTYATCVYAHLSGHNRDAYMALSYHIVSGLDPQGIPHCTLVDTVDQTLFATVTRLEDEMVQAVLTSFRLVLTVLARTF